MSLDVVRRLEADVLAGDGSGEQYRALVAAELDYVAAQQERVREAQAREAAAQQRRASLEAQIRELKERQAAAQAPRVVMSQEACDDYRATYLRLLTQFTVRKEALLYLMAYTLQDVRFADLTAVSAWLDGRAAFFRDAQAALKDLEARASGSPSLPPVAELVKALEELSRVELQARSVIGRERQRRSASSPKSLESFIANQRQLMDWCEAQQQTLAGLSSVEDLTDFSRSFQENVAIMDSNFLVLQEQGEPLAEEPRAQQALQKVIAAWIALAVGTLERLRDAMTQAHGVARLESRCGQWEGHVSDRARSLLTSSQELLEGLAKRERGANVATGTSARQLAEQAGRLIKEGDALRVVCSHLANFSVRLACVQPHLMAVKAELFSDMTTAVMSFPPQMDYEGREDYHNRLHELRDWVQVHSQRTTYARLLGQLEDTQEMIQDYVDVLFPE